MERCAFCECEDLPCPPDCIYAPHFPAGSEVFEKIEGVYGSEVIARVLDRCPPPESHHHKTAVESLAYEAQARLENCVSGAYGKAMALQVEMQFLSAELADTKEKLAGSRKQLAAARQELAIFRKQLAAAKQELAE